MTLAVPCTTTHSHSHHHRQRQHRHTSPGIREGVSTDATEEDGTSEESGNSDRGQMSPPQNYDHHNQQHTDTHEDEEGEGEESQNYDQPSPRSPLTPMMMYDSSKFGSTLGSDLDLHRLLITAIKYSSNKHPHHQQQGQHTHNQQQQKRPHTIYESNKEDVDYEYDGYEYDNNTSSTKDNNFESPDSAVSSILVASSGVRSEGAGAAATSGTADSGATSSGTDTSPMTGGADAAVTKSGSGGYIVLPEITFEEYKSLLYINSTNSDVEEEDMIKSNYHEYCSILRKTSSHDLLRLCKSQSQSRSSLTSLTLQPAPIKVGALGATSTVSIDEVNNYNSHSSSSTGAGRSDASEGSGGGMNSISLGPIRSASFNSPTSGALRYRGKQTPLKQ